MPDNSDRSAAVLNTRTPCYSRSWMGPFLTESFRTCNIVQAAANADVTLTTIHACRLADPAFGQAMIDLDAHVCASLTWSLRARAAAGDNAAAKLLLTHKREIDALSGQGGDRSPMDPRIAEAMIRSGLREAERIGLVGPADYQPESP